jgi:hypothetical protein
MFRAIFFNPVQGWGPGLGDRLLVAMRQAKVAVREAAKLALEGGIVQALHSPCTYALGQGSLLPWPLWKFT